MKKMMILAVMMVMTISANAMSYNAAKIGTFHGFSKGFCLIVRGQNPKSY